MTVTYIIAASDQMSIKILHKNLLLFINDIITI